MSRPVTCLLASCVLIALVLAPATAYPARGSASYYGNLNNYDPKEIDEMLDIYLSLIRLRNAMQREGFIDSEKRSLDFGLGRGYTGSLQAKHLIGQIAANDALGPGRRRRDTYQHEKRSLDFGLDRGYTGSLQAKHLMGQIAANDALGPGRRRRDTHQQ